MIPKLHTISINIFNEVNLNDCLINEFFKCDKSDKVSTAESQMT